MSQETKVHELYDTWTEDIQDAMNSSTTTTNKQLKPVAQALLGEKFRGVFARDTIPIQSFQPGDMAIINTHDSSQPGQHWIPIARGVDEPNKFYYHDSFSKFRLKFAKGAGLPSGEDNLVPADQNAIFIALVAGVERLILYHVETFRRLRACLMGGASGRILSGI